jgi:hypothetical protein
VAGSEHARWSDGIDSAAAHLTGAKVIHVMDRESDDYALLSHLVENDQLFVIRSMHNRILMGEDESRRKLDQAVSQVECEVARQAKLTKRVTGNRSPQQRKIHPTRKARVAQLSVGYTPVVLRKPRPHPRDSEAKRALSLPSSLSLNVVRVWEASPPEGEPPVEWVLLTNTPVQSCQDALQVVERYRARWTIEEYFKALKTGCAYESRQLGDFESLVNAFAVFAAIACTLLAIRSDARLAPDAPAEAVASKDEIDVLRALGPAQLTQEPNASEVLLAIAALGGHIKHNGPPGWQVLWRGYVELCQLTRGWRSARLQPACDQ